jgi:RimJ/RimL family protein N-acetyltransferase
LVLNTRNISLKIPSLEDLEFIRWLWNDPETMEPVGGPIHLSEKDLESWFRGMVSPGSSVDKYQLILDQDQNPIGEISFHRLDPETMTAELNIKVASKHRGRGYAKSALIRFLDEFFNEFGGQVLIDKVGVNNLTGLKVLMNFGFQHKSREEDYHLLEITKVEFNTLYQDTDK